MKHLRYQMGLSCGVEGFPNNTWWEVDLPELSDGREPMVVEKYLMRIDGGETLEDILTKEDVDQWIQRKFQQATDEAISAVAVTGNGKNND